MNGNEDNVLYVKGWSEFVSKCKENKSLASQVIIFLSAVFTSLFLYALNNNKSLINLSPIFIAFIINGFIAIMSRKFIISPIETWTYIYSGKKAVNTGIALIIIGSLGILVIFIVLNIK